MTRVRTLLFLGLLLASSALAGTANAQSTSIQYMNHIDLGMPEQDVFVESADDATKVVRLEGDAAKSADNMAKPAFAASAAVEHDPFKVGANPLGPVDKGEALGFTLGSWLAGTATGTYAVDGDKATVTVSGSKLVPNGVYTVWCSRVSVPPNFNVVDRPCGAADGSENSFTADASGNGSISIETAPLAESSAETVTVIALAYHSDGQSHGANPGAFGLNSHVQLAWLRPAPEAAAAAETMPSALPATGGGDTLYIVLILAVLLVGAGLIQRRAAATTFR